MGGIAVPGRQGCPHHKQSCRQGCPPNAHLKVPVRDPSQATFFLRLVPKFLSARYRPARSGQCVPKFHLGTRGKSSQQFFMCPVGVPSRCAKGPQNRLSKYCIAHPGKKRLQKSPVSSRSHAGLALWAYIPLDPPSKGAQTRIGTEQIPLQRGGARQRRNRSPFEGGGASATGDVTVSLTPLAQRTTEDAGPLPVTGDDLQKEVTFQGRFKMMGKVSI